MSTEADANTFASVTGLEDITLICLKDGKWHQVPEHLVLSSVRRVAHKTANYTILAAESGKLFTNLGATGTITLTLPPATVGLEYEFSVRATQELRIDPDGTETLESTAMAAVAGSAGQYIWANAVGESIKLVCLEAGKWAVLTHRGTWTVA